MKKCDVIIPIYNAYDYVKECLESIKNNTDLKNNKLILINDKSPDDRIEPFLQSFKKENKDLNIILLSNEENLGFVKTVNKGMKYSKNDVLLLNSDTEVTPNWLEKIKDCAYSMKKVASVTPLSNNATLVSVPILFEQNKIPKGYSLKKYSELIEKISHKEYPEIPTANGFCMYIRREALDEVGFFDEETFGKGYGEENDFSYRCLNFGYRHLVCDNTIIYHKGKQSFEGKHNKRIIKNLKKLNEMYPSKVYNAEMFYRFKPIDHIANNVLYNLNIYAKPNILILIHDWKDVKKSLGGTTLHAYDIIKKLKKHFNFHVVAPTLYGYILHSFFEDADVITEFDNFDAYSHHATYNQNYKELLERIISSLNISLIHVHHMIGHYFDILDLIKKYKLYSIITLHDFYFLCPTINLVNEKGSYCEGKATEKCQVCLKSKKLSNGNMISLWRKEHKDYLTQMNKIIVPSEATKAQFSEEFKNIKIDVIEHGINLVRNYLDNKTNDEINIAFVGAIAHIKGLSYLDALIHETKRTKIKVHLFGIASDKAYHKSKRNYTYHGRYTREELPKKLRDNKIDLVCCFSIWPETYSYILTETIACGVPVIAIDLGAVGERVKKYKLGWTINLSDNPKDIVKKIIKIMDNKNEYNKVLNNIRKYKIKNVDEMTQEYYEIYNNNSKVIKTKKGDLYTLLKSTKKTVNTTNLELVNLLNSKRWKFVSKLRIPKVIIKIVRKIMR